MCVCVCVFVSRGSKVYSNTKKSDFIPDSLPLESNRMGSWHMSGDRKIPIGCSGVGEVDVSLVSKRGQIP